MIAVLRTTWTVSLASYADENGIDEDRVPADLGNYLTASINDLPAFEASDIWATCLRARDAESPAGYARVNVDWRINTSREGWLAARDLPRASGARIDLLRYAAQELYDLPSLCETDVVMVARYQLANRRVRCEFRPDQRRRARPVITLTR